MADANTEIDNISEAGESLQPAETTHEQLLAAEANWNEAAYA
jgi:hypothetical protein